MTSISQQLEQIFAKKEHLAEDIIMNKQLVIDYDRKRNSNREALTQIKKTLKEEKKVWLNTGDMFIRLPVEEAQRTINKDQSTLTNQMEETRKSIKQKTAELQRLEGKSTMQGFDLEGMTAGDLYSI